MTDNPSPLHTSPPGGGRAWAVWAAAASVYLVAVFHRSSLSVAGLAAAQRFHVGAAELSSFTMLQLLVYAGMQLPVGLLLDRYGSKRLLISGLVLMTAGQLGFALLPTYAGALAARVLVGLGDAMTFLSVLRLVALWFPPLRNPLLTQLTSITGQIGALATAIPMAHALARFGWSATYVGAALVGLAAGVALYIIVADPDRPSRTAPTPWGAVAANLRASWAEPGVRLGIWAYFLGMFFPNTLVLLWGYPWLVDGLGIGVRHAAGLLTLLTVATMAGGPLIGELLARRHDWRLLLLSVPVVACALLLAAVLAWPGPVPSWLLLALMVATGVGFSSALAAFDFARASTAAARVGTAMALVNVGGFASTVLAVFGIGLVLDLVTPGATAQAHYDASAFRLAMTVPFLLWAVGAVQIWRALLGMERRSPTT